MLLSCDVLVIFPVYGQFGAIQNPDSGHIVCKNQVFINSNLLFYENWKQNSKRSSHIIALSKGIIFAKNAVFCIKLLTSAKLREPWY